MTERNLTQIATITFCLICQEMVNFARCSVEGDNIETLVVHVED